MALLCRRRRTLGTLKPICGLQISGLHLDQKR
jgi:hypothetical protein